MAVLDDIDAKLIDILRRDGRTSNIDLARELGVSEGTVRRRFRALVDEEIVRVVAVTDASKLGRRATALVGLKVAPAFVEAVAGELAGMEEVRYSAVTTGAFDVFCRVSFGSSLELSDFLRNRVGNIPGVRSTETFINLSVKKDSVG